MTRLGILCASCQSTWPLQGVPSLYLEMQLMSQPCPRCEAYTLSFQPLRRPAVAANEIDPDEDVMGVAEPAGS